MLMLHEQHSETSGVFCIAGREGASKIFQMPLSAKLVAQNRMNKTPVLGALSTASAARRAEAAALEVGMPPVIVSYLQTFYRSCFVYVMPRTIV